MNKENLNHVFALQVFEREMKRKPDMSNVQDMATIGILEIGVAYGRSGDLLTTDDLAAIHDVLYDLFEIDLADEDLLDIWSHTDELIKMDAMKWGASDTEVRGSFHEWAEKTMKKDSAGNLFVLGEDNSN
jgi:hypothetical protein